MINITQKKYCCGCMACVQACPVHCIRLEEDKEGFLYPQVNLEQCIDCGKCEKVCPELSQPEERKPLQVYAAINPDEEIRKQSSSEGIFTLLAESVIEENGVVFGACFDEAWNVVHDYTETKEGLAVFRGSKYVQSRIGKSFKHVEQFLKAGRKVLFTGTPCQVMGLKRFLCKDYENLLVVDFVCHGVPSPKVWKSYLDKLSRPTGRKNSVLLPAKPLPSEINRLSQIKSIDFRNKCLGWKKFSFALMLSKATAAGEEIQFCSHVFTENPFMQVFLANLSLRPSCYNCPAKAGKSGSDITIGDFWGIENVDSTMDDDRGTSLVMLNTSIGQKAFSELRLNYREESYGAAVNANSCIEVSVAEPRYRKLFMALCSRFGFKTAYEVVLSKKIYYKLLRRIFLRLSICRLFM